MNTPLIMTSKDILGGKAVFYGTRVPVSTLIDYLAANDTLEEFLDDFPTVTREQAIAYLHMMQEKTLEVAYEDTP